MKKATLTVGLFSMMMVLTSFTGIESIEKSNSTLYSGMQIDHRGGGSGTIPGTGKKLDMRMTKINSLLESEKITNGYSIETGTVLGKRNKMD